MPNIIKSATLCMLSLFLISACGGLQKQVTVSPEEGRKVIAIEASSFKFVPNNIKATQGDEILIKVTNISDSTHNFTLNNPQGLTIKSVDLPAGQTVEISTALSEAGQYEFYCDKPLHPSLGMKGQIEAAKK